MQPCILARRRLLPLAALFLAADPRIAAAQTDYFNLDAGRPVRTEDAYPVERHAFELQLAPLSLERSRAGRHAWGIEPELAYGILPRTQLAMGVPIASVEGAGRRRTGVAGIGISMLHDINVETLSLPAFGIAGELLLPIGALAPSRAVASAMAIATRSFRAGRVHANAGVAFGATPEADAEGAGHAELSRWIVGVAADRAFPLRSTLAIVELHAREPLADDAEVEWNAAAGVRHQLDPSFALDAGIGRRLAGGDGGWFATFGLAYRFAIRSLVAGAGR